VLKIEGQKREIFGKQTRFQIRGNGILFEQLVNTEDLNPKKMEEINQKFRNCLLFLKHVGGYPSEEYLRREPMANTLMMQKLNAWSSSDTGMALKPIDDPLKNFYPFKI